MSGLVEFTQMNGRKVAIQPAAVQLVSPATYPEDCTKECTGVTMMGMAGGWPLNVYVDAPYEDVAKALGLP